MNRSAAEVYDEFFVPALFQQWTARVANAARIQSGDSVLDVACGTGVLTREAAKRVRPGGRCVGLDVNEEMLAVARKASPEIEWRTGCAEELPFDNALFDAVLCQFGLMFFGHRVDALKEMARVLRPGGIMVIAVWDSLEKSPGYAALANLLQRLLGDYAADALRAPFALGDSAAVRKLMSNADVVDITISTFEGVVRFPSLWSWLFTEIKGWVLADRIDDSQFELLIEEGEQVLSKFAGPEGRVEFAAPAHIVTAVTPV